MLENWRGQTTLGKSRLRRNRSKSANGKNVSGDARHTESLHQRSSKSHTKIPINNLADTGFDLRYSTCFEIRQKQGFDLVLPIRPGRSNRFRTSRRYDPREADHPGTNLDPPTTTIGCDPRWRARRLFKDLPAANEPQFPDQILVLSRSPPMACQAQEPTGDKDEATDQLQDFRGRSHLRKRNFSPNAPRFHSLSPPPPTGSILFLTTSLPGSSSLGCLRRTSDGDAKLKPPSSRQRQRACNDSQALPPSPFIRLVLRPPGGFRSQDQALDLVFTQVKTERTIRTMLLNLGATFPNQTNLATALQNPEKPILETQIYSDTRKLRDDPYADMRW